MTMLSEELSSLRKRKRLSQAQVAQYMSENGFPLTQKGISKWECGDTLPNADQFLQLCRLYDIRDVQSVFFHDESGRLNELGLQRLEEYSKLLLKEERFRFASNAFPLYYLDTIKSPEDFENEKLSTSLDEACAIPNGAGFAISLSDESMAPLFEKGRVLFIKKQEKLEPGNFGLFFYKGRALCRLFMPGDGIELISANVSYTPIHVKNAEELITIGKIIDE